MFIERIEVEEGFLAGLRIDFTSGLNVIIGARGTGKTSVIELIRFCLGASAFTQQAGLTSKQQATSILGSGRVSVTLHENSETWVVSRTATDEAPRTDRALPRVVVLAQNEIEAVGASASGRLNLIDEFRSDRDSSLDTIRRAAAHLRTISAEVTALVEDLDEIVAQLADLEHVPAALSAALAAQAEAMASAQPSEEQRQLLTQLQDDLVRTARREQYFKDALDQLSGFVARIEGVIRVAPTLEPWPELDADPLGPVREHLPGLVLDLTRIRASAAEFAGRTTEARTANAERRREVDDEMREVRKAFEAMQAGLGAVTSQVEELQEQAGKRDALLVRRSEYLARLTTLKEERRRTYRVLDAARRTRYEARRAVADELNATVGPAIKVEASQFEDTSAFTTALIGSLRGTGLHYNRVAPLLAQSLDPLELIEAAEAMDTDRLVEATGIQADRAASILATIRLKNAPSVLSADIDDGVRLQLLDGREYKDSTQVSIGQRSPRKSGGTSFEVRWPHGT